MRWPALVLLGAASGCNWAFDLKPTVVVDGGPDGADAPDPAHDRLVWGIAATDNTGAPIDPIEKPIGSEATRSTIPTIQVGGPHGSMLALMDAPYTIADGSFDVPYSLRDAPHRVVYTLPGETVAHEIQWPLTGALLVVPRTTTYDAPVVASGAGYSITPTGLGGYTLPSIATTGVFTFDNRGGKIMTSGATATYNFAADARPLTLPVGAPSAADYIIVGDWTGQTSTQTSLTGFAITQIALTGAASTPATQPAWTTGNRTLKTTLCAPDDCISSVDQGTTNTRLANLGVSGAGTKTYFMAYGISPSIKLPGFVPGPPPDYVDQPLMIPFLTSTSIDSVLTLADPMKAPTPLQFQRVLAARIATPRVVDGATLTTSVQAITNDFTLGSQLVFEAPLAKQIKLDNTTDLSTADLSLTASSQAKTLSWIDDQTNAANDYVVTLYEITNSRLAPLRIYHVITPAVTIDGSLLAPGHKYTFSITSRKGLKKAQEGNYSAANVSYPFSEATTFSVALAIN